MTTSRFRGCCTLAAHSMDEALQILAEEIHPIDDVRSTAAYRRRVCANLLEQFWKETA